jgi:hypothetical protein
MNQRFRAVLLVALSGLAVGLVTGLPVGASRAHHTPNNTEDPVYAGRDSPVKTRLQLEAGIRLVGRALAALTHWEASREPQLLEEADHNAVEGYYFLRAGLASLTWQRDHPKSRSGFVDPMVPLARGKVDSANHLTRNARTDINYVRAGDVSHFAGALDKLQRAIDEVQAALLLI